MPELPEVETTRRGIEPHVLGRTVTDMALRQRGLRWPVSAELPGALLGATVSGVQRRGKYLLLQTERGHLLIHLGMSGSLRVLSAPPKPGRHDHVDIQFDGAGVLRYTDPRRFGCMLWVSGTVAQHPLLASLGPEPLGPEFTGHYLFARSRGRKAPVKSFIMDSRVVVGVGNIYANEALFRAGIHPRRGAGRISARRYELLAEAIRQVLRRAIAAGGTTLRDFTDSGGRPGYFRQQLEVYGRGGATCSRCGTLLRETRLGNRQTVFCPGCQR